MILNKIFRIFKDFLEVSWGKTLIYNFFNLPIHQAVHCPILLYRPHMNFNSYFGHLHRGGVIVKSKSVYFGMIKLGKQSEKTCTTKGFWLYNQGTIIFNGPTLMGNGCRLEIKKGAKLEIGENTGMTGETSINCYESISLGRFFSCAWNVQISDTDFHDCYKINGEGKKTERPFTNPISIGNFVWVCKGVTILKGTVLSDWCTVGANSLVIGQHNLPPYSLIAGSPAKDTGEKLLRKDLDELKSRTAFVITKGLATF
jgi:acetyltransferase-like isoleucine patch superfamily enzyme